MLSPQGKAVIAHEWLPSGHVRANKAPNVVPLHPGRRGWGRTGDLSESTESSTVYTAGLLEPCHVVSIQLLKLNLADVLCCILQRGRHAVPDPMLHTGPRRQPKRSVTYASSAVLIVVRVLRPLFDPMSN